MKTNLRVNLWLSATGLSLIGMSVGVFLWLSPPLSISTAPPTTPNNLNANPASPAVLAAVTNPTAFLLVSPQLPPVAYPRGSVGEACELNDFPPYHWYYDLDRETRRSLENSPFDNNGYWKLQEKCLSALERHMSLMNPYLWGDDTKNRAFSFVSIDNPVTFERIFTNSAGDFARVQDALARPECQLDHEAESNWKLNETCHADAIFNYALLTRFCYNDYDSNGVNNRTNQYYSAEDNPTPEQDRTMWIQHLEDVWVRKKCRTLDPNLNLYSDFHTDLRKQIKALQGDDQENKPLRQFDSSAVWQNKSLNATLIDLAARLGDAGAALAEPRLRLDRKEQGYKYGRFADWFTYVVKPTDMFDKYPPTVARLSQIIPLFTEDLGGSNHRDMLSITSRGEIRRSIIWPSLNHEALVQHLCSPPFYVSSNEFSDPPSCRTVVNELRQEYHNNDHMLELIATFEEIAMRLDVYE